MNNTIAAEQLLDKICEIDNTIRLTMIDKEIKTHVITEMSKSFENIVNSYPHLVEDIQCRIVKYHTNKGLDGKITDFVHLVDWYSMSLMNNSAEYWDANGKYYGLRMCEVISMFLMARFNCDLI
jgi:hypothetical protein